MRMRASARPRACTLNSVATADRLMYMCDSFSDLRGFFRVLETLIDFFSIRALWNTEHGTQLKKNNNNN